MQYLNEARATEDALVRVLQSQIAVTPRGSYRSALESHLDETRGHSARIGERLQALGQGTNPLMSLLGFWESAIGQTVAISKAPFDLLRGTSGEEKLLKNAKDTCATEALEIATYTAIERLARAVDDEETASLAESIRADEEKMLQRVMREVPRLAAAVVNAELKGKPTYDLTTTGAADAVREASEATKDAAEDTAEAAKNTARESTAATKEAARKTAAATDRAARRTGKRTARQVRKVPGAAQAEGQVRGAVASEEDLAIPRYDQLTAEEINQRLSELSQVELTKIDAYERRHQDRTTVLERVGSLRGEEPWPGYDELTVDDIQAALSDADDERLNRTRTYERAHKNRVSVLRVTEREHSNV